MADNLLSNLATALAAAQGQMAHAAKDSKNPHFKSSYASLASVLDAIREPLSANGLAIVQHPSRTEGGLVCVETILLHKSGEFVSSVLSAKAAQDTPQGIGSTITYLRRYGLMAVVGIAADDDDGEAASRPLPRREIPAALNDHAPRTTPAAAPAATFSVEELERELLDRDLLLSQVAEWRVSLGRPDPRDPEITGVSRAALVRHLDTTEGLAAYRAWVAGGAP